MAATTWMWIKPIPMRGFQGFRYVDPQEFDPPAQIVGDWKAPRP
jgi:hypothetical protein